MTGKYCPRCGMPLDDRRHTVLPDGCRWEEILGERHVREVLDTLRGMDELGRVAYLMGVSRERLEELGGL